MIWIERPFAWFCNLLAGLMRLVPEDLETIRARERRQVPAIRRPEKVQTIIRFGR